MTFLTPGLAMLAAGIGVPALILLHVLRLRRLPQRVASTLLWRRSVQDLEANVPFQHLRFSWLLLLQLLALLCAALAAGQPVLRRGEPPSAMVVVIDARARMNAVVGNAGARAGAGAASAPENPKERRTDAGAAAGIAARGRPVGDAPGAGPIAPELPPAPTRFDRAKEAAKSWIRRRASDETPVRLVVARARPALVASGSPRSVVDAIDRLEPTHEPGDAAEAMALAAQVAPEGEIRWIGDPDEVRSDNAGITILSAQRGLAEPGTVDLLIGAVNSGASAIEAPLVVTIDGEVMAARVLRIPGAPEDPREPPGRATALLRVPARPGATLEARLVVEDAFPLDDSASLRFAPAAPIRVAFIAPAMAEDHAPASGPRSPLLNLLRVMDAVVVTVLPCDAPSSALRDFDLVVADGCVPAIVGAADGPPWLVFAWPRHDAGESAGGAAPPRLVRASAAPPGAARPHPLLHGLPPFVVEALMPESRSPSSEPRDRLVLLEDQDGVLAWVDPRAPGVRFEFPLSATEWTSEPSWVMAMQNAVLWLVGDDGEGVGAPIRTGHRAKVLAERHDGSREWVAVAPPERLGEITVQPRAGAPIRLRVSLLDEAQSDLRRAPAPEDPRAFEPSTLRRSLSSRDDAAQRRDESGGAVALWPWLAVGALLLLAAEWSLYLAALNRRW